MTAEHRAKLLEKIKIIHASKEHKEPLKRLHAQLSIRV
jgi:hypothetical protein